MMTWLDPIFDLTQPFFFYSVVFSILFASLTYITLKVLRVHNPQLKSIFYMIPLFVPLVVFAIFPPSYFMGEFSIANFSTKSSNPEVFTIQFLSVAGSICLTGLAAGTALLVFLYMFGSRIVRWLQGVVEFSSEETPKLVATVKKVAESVGVSMPLVGISEDLRPNAFTIGYGKKTMMVFTSGLLRILDGTELEAVIAHEVAHIKNRDFHFMALISALKAISFFNPLVYLLSSAIKKEREVLADNTGMTLIERPETLGLALTKIWEDSKGFSGGFLKGWISSFFIVSEIRHVRNVLATHPILESRLSNIAEGTSLKNASRNEVLRAITACAVVIVMVICVSGLLTQMHSPVRRMHVISFGPERTESELLISSSRVATGGWLIQDHTYRSGLSSIHFYAYATPAGSHQVPVLTYSWILTSVDIAVVATIFLLSFRNNFGVAIKNLRK